MDNCPSCGLTASHASRSTAAAIARKYKYDSKIPEPVRRVHSVRLKFPLMYILWFPVVQVVLKWPLRWDFSVLQYVF